MQQKSEKSQKRLLGNKELKSLTNVSLINTGDDNVWIEKQKHTTLISPRLYELKQFDFTTFPQKNLSTDSNETEKSIYGEILQNKTCFKYHRLKKRLMILIIKYVARY